MSETQETFSFADLNLASTPDMAPVAAGEYLLSLRSIEKKTYDKDGKSGSFLNIRFEIEGQPTAPDVYHTLFLPKASDTEKQRNQTASRIKDMFKALNAPLDLSASEQLVGRQAWAVLAVTEDPVYGRKNSIKSFIFGPPNK